MYKSFFGLEEEPFRVNPDPRFLYASESHREALAMLVYAVRERKGFLVLSGEVGTGKTTIVNALLKTLDPDVQTAFLFNTVLSIEDFFSYVFEELGLDPVVPFRKAEGLHRLNQHLIERLRKGRQTLLIVDEAQNLSAELLEEIRMLSNLETPQSKLLQIFLVGQPELERKLAQPELRQLRQRVEFRHRIRPLTGSETAEYVRERLLVAGHETGEIFSRPALRAVHRHSAGIPRRINVLCDNALLIGFSRGSAAVSERFIEEAARDLRFAGEEKTERPAPRSFLRRFLRRSRNGPSVA
jgi:general secretion pathway protein A